MPITLLGPTWDYGWAFENDQAFWWGAFVLGLFLLGAFLYAARSRNSRR